MWWVIGHFPLAGLVARLRVLVWSRRTLRCLGSRLAAARACGRRPTRAARTSTPAATCCFRRGPRGRRPGRGRRCPHPRVRVGTALATSVRVSACPWVPVLSPAGHILDAVVLGGVAADGDERTRP